MAKKPKPSKTKKQTAPTESAETYTRSTGTSVAFVEVTEALAQIAEEQLAEVDELLETEEETVDERLPQVPMVLSPQQANQDPPYRTIICANCGAALTVRADSTKTLKQCLVRSHVFV